MATYKAKHGFDDDRLGKVKRNQSLELTESQAKPYTRAGLIRLAGSADVAVNEPNPILAAGTQQSASPAAQASPQATAKPQKRGRKPKAAEPSSS